MWHAILWPIWLGVAGTIARKAHDDWVNPNESRGVTLFLIAVFGTVLAVAAFCIWRFA